MFGHSLRAYQSVTVRPAVVSEGYVGRMATSTPGRALAASCLTLGLLAAATASVLPGAGALTVGAPIATASLQAAPADAVALATLKYKFANCTAMNKVYPHGVGRDKAKDKTSGRPVTTFKRSTTLYNKIIGYRSSLDRDRDGIACEKR